MRRSLPQQTRRFPRIDSRSIEASSAPTRRGAACARGRRLKAGTPLVLLASSVQWPRGEFKKTLGDRSRRRLQVSEITLRSQAGLCAISLAPLHKFGIDVAPGAQTSTTKDLIGDGTLADNRAGLAFLRVAYSDGSKGILVVSCDLPGNPPPGPAGSPHSIFEGITASKGFVDYWNRAAPVPRVDGNRTLFHVVAANKED